MARSSEELSISGEYCLNESFGESITDRFNDSKQALHQCQAMERVHVERIPAESMELQERVDSSPTSTPTAPTADLLSSGSLISVLPRTPASNNSPTIPRELPLPLPAPTASPPPYHDENPFNQSDDDVVEAQQQRAWAPMDNTPTIPQAPPQIPPPLRTPTSPIPSGGWARGRGARAVEDASRSVPAPGMNASGSAIDLTPEEAQAIIDAAEIEETLAVVRAAEAEEDAAQIAAGESMAAAIEAEEQEQQRYRMGGGATRGAAPSSESGPVSAIARALEALAADEAMAVALHEEELAEAAARASSSAASIPPATAAAAATPSWNAGIVARAPGGGLGAQTVVPRNLGHSANRAGASSTAERAPSVRFAKVLHTPSTAFDKRGSKPTVAPSCSKCQSKVTNHVGGDAVCRNCLKAVCDRCVGAFWARRMIPTKNIPKSNTHRMRICRSCHVAMESFRKALLLGRLEDAMAAYSLGVVNIHAPYTIYHGEWPVHCAAAGGNATLLSWLVEDLGCPLFEDCQKKRPLKDGRHVTVLGAAAVHGQVQTMRYLIGKGCCVSEIKHTPTLKRALKACLLGSVKGEGRREDTTDESEAQKESGNPGGVIGGGGSGGVVVPTDEDSNLCIVCYDSERDCTLVPCGHHCLCLACASRFNECPICRSPIQKKIKTITV